MSPTEGDEDSGGRPSLRRLEVEHLCGAAASAAHSNRSVMESCSDGAGSDSNAGVAVCADAKAGTSSTAACMDTKAGSAPSAQVLSGASPPDAPARPYPGAPSRCAPLPADCVALVLRRCSPRDICRLAAVSRTWRHAAASEDAWERHLPLAARQSLAHYFGLALPLPPAGQGQGQDNGQGQMWGQGQGQRQMWGQGQDNMKGQDEGQSQDAEAGAGQGIGAGVWSPQAMVKALRKGVHSLDGLYYLTTDSQTGTLCLHVSAVHALTDRRQLPRTQTAWRAVGGLPGAMFEPSASLVVVPGMRLTWRVSPPFALPWGEYRVMWRVGTQSQGVGPPAPPDVGPTGVSPGSRALHAGAPAAGDLPSHRFRRGGSVPAAKVLFTLWASESSEGQPPGHAESVKRGGQPWPLGEDVAGAGEDDGDDAMRGAAYSRKDLELDLGKVKSIPEGEEGSPAQGDPDEEGAPRSGALHGAAPSALQSVVRCEVHCSAPPSSRPAQTLRSGGGLAALWPGSRHHHQQSEQQQQQQEVASGVGSAPSAISQYLSAAGRRLFARCSCKEVALVQKQHRDILRSLKELDTVEWERILLPGAAVAPAHPEPSLATARVSASDAEHGQLSFVGDPFVEGTSHGGWRVSSGSHGGVGHLDLHVVLEESRQNKGESALYVDSFAFTLVC